MVLQLAGFGLPPSPGVPLLVSSTIGDAPAATSASAVAIAAVVATDPACASIPPPVFSAVDEVPALVSATAATALAAAFDPALDRASLFLPMAIREVPAIAAAVFSNGRG